MKIFISFFAIILSYAAYIQAQEVKMSSIPFPMHFENKMKDYKVLSKNHIRIVAPANIDLFVMQGVRHK